jgi:polyisoprenoid-binding protein YceI
MTAVTSSSEELLLEPGRWEFDRAHSHVGFSIRHLGISTIRGAFRDVDAELVVGGSLADTVVTATIEMASMDTGLADRDQRLLEPGLVHVERRPQLVYSSTEIAPDGDGWSMLGDLRIGEVSAPVELAVAFGGVREFALDGRVHAGFEARGTIKRSDYGVHFGQFDVIVSDDVPLQLDLQFLAPADG